ncbi:MAG: hypothetical protein V3T86_05070 [Planctomycetota bacterium]
MWLGVALYLVLFFAILHFVDLLAARVPESPDTPPAQEPPSTVE